MTESAFKGVMLKGLRFNNCKKLSISGTVNSTGSLLRLIDELCLEKLETFSINVSDAEEEGVAANGDKPSHLLLVLKFIENIASSHLNTVRIKFNSLHLAHLIQAFSSAKPILTDEDEADLTSKNVFSKVGRLFSITCTSLTVPMQFMDDLNLTSSAFLSKHYLVTHKIKPTSSKDQNRMNPTVIM
jgi:hypothetical protein